LAELEGTHRISHQTQDGVAVVSFEGELDLATCADLREALDRVATDSRPVVLDLARCPFIDSSGIAVLIHASRELDGGDGRAFAVAGCGNGVSRVLKLTGVDGLIASFDTPDQAIASFASS